MQIPARHQSEGPEAVAATPSTAPPASHKSTPGSTSKAAYAKKMRRRKAHRSKLKGSNTKG
jgi:hypothetical protein